MATWQQAAAEGYQVGSCGALALQPRCRARYSAPEARRGSFLALRRLSGGRRHLRPYLAGAGVHALEALVERMGRDASQLLWRHVALECGLLRLLRALKTYFLLGRHATWQQSAARR